MRILRLSSLLPIVLLACSAPPVPRTTPSPTAFPDLPADEFPGADRLLRGFDRRDADTDWKAGDAVLFGLRLIHGSDIHRWLLRLTVAGRLTSSPDDTEGTDSSPRRWTIEARIAGERHDVPIESRMNPVLVEVFDEHASALGATRLPLPRDLLAHGLRSAIEAALRLRRSGRPVDSFERIDDVLPMARGVLAMVNLLGVLQEDETLSKYFWLVVRRPSLLSVLGSLGVEVSLEAGLRNGRSLPPLPGPLSTIGTAYAMPVQVLVNRQVALDADIVAADSARPLGLCGGIVAVSARHPTEPDLRLDVQLLAARLGPN